MIDRLLVLVLLLAPVVEGEADVVRQAMPMVANSVVNRMEDPRWPSTLAGVIEDGYNGWASPSQQAYAAAYDALTREADPTGGVVFVLSGADRKMLGCSPGDVVYVVPGRSVHGYFEWPCW